MASFKTARNWTITNRLALLEIKLQEKNIHAVLMLGPGMTSHRDEYAAALQTTKRTNYIPIAEEELASVNAEDDISFENMVAKMASFTKRVFNEFNPIMEQTSNALKASSDQNSQ